MTTHVMELTRDVDIENDVLTADEAKARRNAEYLAKIDLSLRQIERGEVVSMTYEEWEEWIKNV